MGVQGEAEILRVVVADKAIYARLVLEDIISDASGMQVVGMAATGDELLKLQKERQADVIVLDYDLPHNEKLYTLRRIFNEQPAAVLLLLMQEQLTLKMMQQAIELGVYGIILKPGKGLYVNYRGIAAEVVQKIRAIRASDQWHRENQQHIWQHVMENLPLRPKPPKRRNSEKLNTVIVIGASTGGTKAVEQVIRQLTATMDATVLVALHLPQSFTSTYAQRLQEITGMEVQEGHEGLQLKRGSVVVAPGGRNMVVRHNMGDKTNLRITFSDEKPTTYDLPSIDLLMKSVGESEVPHKVGVILTGMGKDGTAGAAFMQQSGGEMIAQDEESSTIFGMAKSAIESGYIDKVLPLAEIPHHLNRYVAGKQQVSATDSVA